MSKRKNKRGSALDNLFGGGVNPYGTQTAEAVQTRPITSGDLLEVDIVTVMPDPQQPRELLSAELYAALFNGSASPIQTMTAWQTTAQQGSSAEKQAFADLQQLAQTIEMHGLINPITVRPVQNDAVPPQVSYLIRTGERRWWAHVLLTLQQRKIKGSQPAERIRALVDTDTTHLRAEQLVENMARADLSVIEKARGIEALRNDMAAQRGRTVRWEEVEQLLGISRNYRWRLGKVLELPPPAVALVAQHNLPERSLRPVVDKLAARPDLQIRATEQLVIWQDAGEEIGHKRVDELVVRLMREGTTPLTKSADLGLSGWSAKFGRTLNKSLKLIDELDDAQLAGYAAMLANDDKSAEKLRRLHAQLTTLLTTTDSTN